MSSAPKSPLLCWKWPWDALSNLKNPNSCGNLEVPWLFKSLQSVGSLAQTLLFNNAAVSTNGEPSNEFGRKHARLSMATPLTREEQGEAEQRALASALASGKAATVVEFYSPKCRLCNSLLDLVLELEARNSDWVSFVLADAENERWLPEVRTFCAGVLHKYLNCIWIFVCR